MKKFSIIILLMFLCSFVSQAQKPYSVENLEKLSSEELNLYFNRAQKLQKDGKKVTNIGLITLGADVIFVTGLTKTGNLLTASGAIAGLAMYAALGTIAVGIPLKTTGKNRVERINKIKNTVYDNIKIDLKPCIQYSLVTQNYQPGITFRIRF